MIPNAATRRWLRGDPRGPGHVRAVNRISASIGRRIPLSAGDRLARLGRVEVPLFGPAAPLKGWPERLLDTSPLYAGQTVTRIDDVRPAAELVRALAG